MVAGITFYGVWKLQGAMMNSEQYYNDPRHPRCTPPFPLLFILEKRIRWLWYRMDGFGAAEVFGWRLMVVKHANSAEKLKVIQDHPGAQETH